MVISDWAVEELFFLTQMGTVEDYFCLFQSWRRLSHSDFPEEFFLALFINGLQSQVHDYVKILHSSTFLDAYEVALIAEYQLWRLHEQTCISVSQETQVSTNEDNFVAMLHDALPGDLPADNVEVQSFPQDSVTSTSTDEAATVHAPIFIPTSPGYTMNGVYSQEDNKGGTRNA